MTFLPTCFEYTAIFLNSEALIECSSVVILKPTVTSSQVLHILTLIFVETKDP